MWSSHFNELDVVIKHTEVPSLKSFSSSLIEPLGKAVVNLQVRVDARVEIIMVPDDLLKYSILLGQTFTEQAGIVITKTDEHLIPYNA